MPSDDDLPPSRLPERVEQEQIVRHFSEAFGIRVDVEGIEALPASERLSLAGARPPEPPEAVLLDRVLQLVPAALLTPVARIVMLPSRGTAREGGSRNRIIRLSAHEARMYEGDPRYGRAFSVFTTTVLHEIGHVVFEECLSDAQQRLLADEYLKALIAADEEVPPGEPSDVGVHHHFIRYFIAALLGQGEPGVGAGESRWRLADLGLDLHRGEGWIPFSR